MSLRRQQRCWLSRWLITALLFMQFAAAGYACPMVGAESSASSVMAAMPGCDGHMTGTTDPAQPQLCKAHCQQGSQTVNQTLAPDVQPVPVLLAVLDWAATVRVPEQATDLIQGVASGASPRGSPPRYLALLVLRN